MADSYKKTKAPASSSPFRELESMHPYKMLLLLAMIGSTLIFFFLLTVYSASRTLVNPPVHLHYPKAFVISTLILLLSAFTIHRAAEHFRKEKRKRLHRALVITLFLGIAFAISQGLGWNELSNQHFAFNSKGVSTYLYTISAIHILLVSLGLIFLTYCYVLFLKTGNDPVKSLIYYTNPFRKLQLEMLNMYWQYMNTIWLLLSLFFLFTF